MEIRWGIRTDSDVNLCPLRIYDPDRKLHLELDRNGYLERCVHGKSVLHVGCSDWPITGDRLEHGTLLHMRLQRAAKSVIGIDLSEAGIAALRSHGISNVKVMDAETMHLDESFDVIVAGDVLEHMSNPGMFVKKAASLLKQDGELIVGVPSALTINNMKVWFGGWEQVHSDHTIYFSPKTLSALLGRFGLLPVRLVFTVQAPGSHESRAFLMLRQIVLKLITKMSPSIIMHFKKADDIRRSHFFEWK